MKVACTMYSQIDCTRDTHALLDKICRIYFQLHGSRFLTAHFKPTTYLLGIVVPYYAKKIWDELGVGMGIYSTQATESCNKTIEKVKDGLTNKRENQWEQIAEHEYLAKVFLPNYCPHSSDHTDKTKTTRFPDKDDECFCGRAKGNSDLWCATCQEMEAPVARQCAGVSMREVFIALKQER